MENTQCIFIILNDKKLDPDKYKTNITNIIDSNQTYANYYNSVQNKTKNKLPPKDKKNPPEKTLSKLTDNLDEINI